ncbi:TetR/AcrR family transcriptional regulator [Paenibacillus caseinilyticus]|uniref:TetR family transcriptional regulator n=1 Tax=Paenibacillus mucilaginosus K02 TaxID=997761 RepID=I0BBU5_9BACL|nr:TetR family transcriptional regulator [Paenibacillus mucilaginosus]AFH59842.1 TetR family transcriptional regulator [Paenibacillus mucilaginosus K02]
MSTQELILESAYRLFARHGFEKTSLSMIAKEVGISKPAVYYYFPSKEALFGALLEAVCSEIRFGKYFPLASFTVDNYKEQLTGCGLRMIGEQRSDPHYSLLMKEFMIQSTRDESIQSAMMAVIQTYVEGFHELLRHGADLGIVQGEDLRAKAEQLTMIVDGIDNYMGLGVAFDYERLWSYTVEQVLR